MDSSDGESWKPSGSVKMKRQTSRRGSSIKLKKKELKTEKEFERSRSHEDTMEMLSPKQNGFAEGDEGDTDEEGKQQGAIKGMWKKALKTLKSTDSKPSKLSKKGSFTKRKDSESEEEPQEPSKEVDPVYSLLKCAADLPKVHKAQKDGGHLSCKADGYDNTSKASSPTSSVSHSPKTRRKKMITRTKSFSWDMSEPLKQQLAMEDTPKKSFSFTNSPQPGNGPLFSKKRLGLISRSASLETDDSKDRSRSCSPPPSPKPKKKEENVYVSLYHFRGKEKDDMDLRPGSRVTVKNTSNPDWWKGKCNGKSGYFPAKYLLKLQKYQRVYQVSQTLNLVEIDGQTGMKLHKDQIVLSIGEVDGDASAVRIKTANSREAMCPLQFLQEI